MAERLGMWVQVHPGTPVFVPEHRVVALPPAHILLPIVGRDRLYAVMSEPDDNGYRRCIGWALVDVSPRVGAGMSLGKTLDAHVGEVWWKRWARACGLLVRCCCVGRP